MADLSRVFDGFMELSRGQDGGRSANLINKNQYSAGSNITIRGGLPTTRPPFSRIPLTFTDRDSFDNFDGVFQGATFYDSPQQQEGIVLSRAGRLFKINLGDGPASINEITPRFVIATTADFVPPAISSQVTIDVNSESEFAVGDTIYINSGQYIVDALFLKQILVTYNGGSASTPVVSGSAILDVNGYQFIEYQTGSPTARIQCLFQAENYVIVLRGQYSSVIFDGAVSKLATITQVPPGVIGTYGMGRIWVTLNDYSSFRGGDILFGSSGTPALGYRDSILYFTENDFLNEGGDFQTTVFGSPYNAGPITAMQFIATQDTSLGLGNLLVFTTNMAFSVDTPFDRTTWKNLRFPIKTVSLIDYGATGMRALASINGDIWYRSTDGIRSFIVARRNFGTWGNVPLSYEMNNILKYDTENLLGNVSCVNFDNKYFTTVSPYNDTLGVAYKGLAITQFDTISSLVNQAVPAWEGSYSGLNILQILKGRVGGIERMFALVSGEQGIELWEVNKRGDYDLNVTVDETGTTITQVPISWFLETRSMDFGDASQLKSLYTSEFYIDDIVDDITILVKYKPDQYPDWITWKEIKICTSTSQCSPPSNCTVWRTKSKLYAARVMLPQPQEPCNTVQGGQVRLGYEYQIRLEGLGHSRVRMMKVHAKVRSDKQVGNCPPDCEETGETKSFEACGVEWFDYSSHGNIPEPPPIPPPPPPVPDHDLPGFCGSTPDNIGDMVWAQEDYAPGYGGGSVSVSGNLITFNLTSYGGQILTSELCNAGEARGYRFTCVVSYDPLAGTGDAVDISTIVNGDPDQFVAFTPSFENGGVHVLEGTLAANGVSAVTVTIVQNNGTFGPREGFNFNFRGTITMELI